MGGALGMVPSRVPIVEPSTRCAFAVKACKVSKDPILYALMFLLSKLEKYSTGVRSTPQVPVETFSETSCKKLDGWGIGYGPF
jgi:hypothetical protein